MTRGRHIFILCGLILIHLRLWVRLLEWVGVSCFYDCLLSLGLFVLFTRVRLLLLLFLIARFTVYVGPSIVFSYWKPL